MGGEYTDVGQADRGQMGAHDVKGELEVVAFATEMGEEDLLEGVAGDVGEQGGGRFVGEVALAAEDALFEGPRAEGVVHQSFVVVGFEHDELASAQAFAGELRGHAEVGGDAEAGGAAGEDEAHGRVGIVGQGERQDLDVANPEGATIGEEVPFKLFGPADGPRGVAVGVEFQTQLLVKLANANGVVGMLVRDADGTNLGGVELGIGHAAQGFARGDARIHEESRCGAFDIDAIAATAAGEHADAQLGGGRGHPEGSGFGVQEGAETEEVSSAAGSGAASAALRRLRNSRASWR